MNTTTARLIIEDALGIIGVLGPGDSLLAEEYAKGFRFLNSLVSSLNLEDMMIRVRVIDKFPLVVNQQVYEIGPTGADLETSLITKLATCEVNDLAVMDSTNPNQSDSYVLIVENAEFQRINQKWITAEKPTKVYPEYLTDVTRLHFWPIPMNGYICTISSLKALSSFADQTTEYTLPDGYADLYSYELAKRLAPIYKKSLSIETLEIARELKRVLKVSNGQIPKLGVETMLVRLRHAGYNIRTDA